MANHDSDQWIDDRLAGLSAGRDWTPNAGRAFARLQSKSRARASAVRRWLLTSFAAVTACVALIVVPASRACAQQPGACVLKVLGVDRRAPGQSTENFKQFGDPAAPVTLEIFLDDQCGRCPDFIRDVVPVLRREYVDTGKTKLLYRYSPPPAHAGHSDHTPFVVIVSGENRQAIADATLTNVRNSLDQVTAR